jgi:homogentisate 1,2-dioxygenase
MNGKELGTVYTKPFKLICDGLNTSDNVLEVEVTTLAANRIRDMDRSKVQWKYFNDINIVNINYKPFDASNWELVDSGLIGPVRLIPAKVKIIR